MPAGDVSAAQYIPCVSAILDADAFTRQARHRDARRLSYLGAKVFADFGECYVLVVTWVVELYMF